VVLVKLRMRLLGPLVSLLTNSIQAAGSLHSNSVDTAFHEIDTTLDHLSAALGLTPAA
jgi:hypothetical protein